MFPDMQELRMERISGRFVAGEENTISSCGGESRVCRDAPDRVEIWELGDLLLFDLTPPIQPEGAVDAPLSHGVGTPSLVIS